MKVREIPIDLECDEDRWRIANKDVIWGWKRDDGAFQRVIFFSGRLHRTPKGKVRLLDWCFYYRHRAGDEAISWLYSRLNRDSVTSLIGTPVVRASGRAKLKTVELKGGPGLEANAALLRRLLQRRPRRGVPVGEFAKPRTTALDFRQGGPIYLYAGSGLSYEAGLPTLGQVHETFGVDRLGARGFTFGLSDPIPTELEKDAVSTFARFAELHTRAAVAEPSSSHFAFARWAEQGVISKIYTDNIDNLFALCGAKVERTRGVGIFNDPYQVSIPREATLLVVGIAADRRSIISQARSTGSRIVVVNPKKPVSPRSQNLSYVRVSDIWYRMDAFEFCALHGFTEQTARR